VRARSADPHVVLAAAAVLALGTEWATVRQGSAAWVVLRAVVAGAALAAAWLTQERLRLMPVLVLGVGLQLAWIALDLALGVTSVDSAVLYRQWGNALLHGHYPDSQYPPAATLLFAFDALVGGGPTRTSHMFAMVPLQAATVVAVWGLRTGWSRWLAAFVALWPLNVFSWEFRFDLLPTALLALGLLFALRGRWGLSGALLGLGAAAKWTPALAAAALVVWLLSGRRWRPAIAHAAMFAVVFLALHVPFLAWSPDETLYSYRYFNSQGLTGESVWYLVLAPLGRASVSLQAFWLPAVAPSWVKPATVVAQALALLALAAIAWRVRGSIRAGVAVAAMAPVLFLLLNRVFSPQYLVLMTVAWAIGAALVVHTKIEQLCVGLAVMVATTANALVYPYTLFQHGLWRLASAVLFVSALGTTIAILVRAARSAGEHAALRNQARRP
jgi:hypothetical protein